MQRICNAIRSSIDFARDQTDRHSLSRYLQQTGGVALEMDAYREWWWYGDELGGDFVISLVLERLRGFDYAYLTVIEEAE